MKKKSGISLIVAIVILVGGYILESKFPGAAKLLKSITTSEKSTKQTAAKLAPGEYTAEVKKVSDGDTIVVNVNGEKAKLRLLWIDTPEKSEGYKLLNDADKCGVSKRKMRDLGQKATAYAKRNFHVKDKVKIKIEGQGDFKRYLALIWNKNGELYNEEVIKDGYACIYTKKKYPKYLEELLAEAKKKRRGLWKDYYKIMNCLCYENRKK